MIKREKKLEKYFDKLWPIPRSITGPEILLVNKHLHSGFDE